VFVALFAAVGVFWGSSGDATPKSVGGGEKSLLTFESAAAAGDDEGLTAFLDGNEKNDAFSGLGPITSATIQFRTAARTPKALVGMWRTCTFIKSDRNPAKIAISGRKTPSRTINVDIPPHAALPYEATVSIIVQ
jgi:hypothetical protein